MAAVYLAKEMFDDAIPAYRKSLDLGAGNIVLSALGCCLI